MIAKPADYAAKAEQAARADAEAARATHAKDRLQKRLGGRFVGPDGLTYRILSAAAAEILDGGLIVGMATGDRVTLLLDDIDAGVMVELTAAKPVQQWDSLTTGGVEVQTPARPMAETVSVPKERMKLASMLKAMNVQLA